MTELVLQTGERASDRSRRLFLAKDGKHDDLLRRCEPYADLFATPGAARSSAV